MKCIRYNAYVTYAFTVFTQVTLVFAFLIIFYFNYVNFVEKDAFIDQIGNVMDDLSVNIRKYLPKSPTVVKSIDKMITNLKTKTNHKDIDTKNENLTIFSMHLVFALTAGFIVFVIIVTLFGHCLPLKSVFKESMLALIFIALTEFIFLQIVVKQYIAADPNRVKYSIWSTIYNYASKKIKK